LELDPAFTTNVCAETVRTWKTYKRADGEMICGEYGWVADLDYFDDVYGGWSGDYLEVVEETWQLVETRTIKLGSLNRWCDVCDEDIDLKEPIDGPVYCAAHTDGKGGAE